MPLIPNAKSITGPQLWHVYMGQRHFLDHFASGLTASSASTIYICPWWYGHSIISTGLHLQVVQTSVLNYSLNIVDLLILLLYLYHLILDVDYSGSAAKRWGRWLETHNITGSAFLPYVTFRQWMTNAPHHVKVAFITVTTAQSNALSYWVTHIVQCKAILWVCLTRNFGCCALAHDQHHHPHLLLKEN